ncbi:MAG: helix-turn-helix domain-containing protein [Halanaeroarchaeum sp.]
MIDITMDMEQYDCPFIDTTDDHAVAFSAVQWEFDTQARQLETRLVVEGADRSVLDDGLAALRDHQNMREFELLVRNEDIAQIHTRIGETDAMGTIRDHDGYVTGPFYIAEGSEVWHVGFDRDDHAEAALSELERNNEFDVVDRTGVEPTTIQGFVDNVGAAMTLIEGAKDLSAVERRTLERAVDGGYFNAPRDTDLGDLADEFDVSKPAVSKNLRRGQRKMLQRIVEAFDDIE